MKKTHIAAIIMLIAAIVMLALSSQNLSSFSTFDKAEKSKNRVKVVGQLSQVDPVMYEPEVNPNFFSFWMVDEEGVKRKVVINEPKMRDFERSEQIVVTGKMSDEQIFEASEILLKCPSKYAEEQLSLRKET